MNCKVSGVLAVALPALLAGLAGCSTASKTLGIGNESVADYRSAKTVDNLEVPPDLSTSAIDDALVVPDDSVSAAEISRIQQGQLSGSAGRSQVLPGVPDIQVERDGDNRWLLINADADAVWPKVRDFWLESGFLIKMEDSTIGIMETDWSENRADIPSGPIRNFLKSSFDFIYSTATRDKFRVRLERGTRPHTTELFLTHRGVEQVEPTGDAGSSPENSVWQNRPPDPELEAEMLSRIMIYLGVGEEQARDELNQERPQAPRARLSKGGDSGVVLTLDEDLPHAWRLTGLALDRVGFTVEDRNRAERIYYVQYDDPLKEQQSGGILSKMAFWKDDETPDDGNYQVKLEEDGDQTRVVVRNAAGEPDNSPTAGRILSLLYEQLR